MDAILSTSIGIIFVYVSFWFLVWLVYKRNDIADIVWWSVYIIICLYFISLWDISTRQWIIYSLVFLRWTRLIVHIYMRNKNKKEDFRYANRRKLRWKRFVLRSYLQIYLLQWAIAWIIMAPIYLVRISSPSELWLIDYLWVIIWIAWFLCESISDYQLKAFKADQNNSWKILDTWLWKYSRHPNYFGESLMWWWIFIVGLSASYGIYWIISPLMITFLLLHVSWIPMLEKKYETNTEYQKYKHKTSRFIPLPPKS